MFRQISDPVPVLWEKSLIFTVKWYLSVVETPCFEYNIFSKTIKKGRRFWL